MAANWGVFEVYNNWEEAQELHNVPMVDLDGEGVMSAAHVLSSECRCGPLPSTTKYGLKLWNHHDPDHKGAQTEEEFRSGDFNNSEEVKA